MERANGATTSYTYDGADHLRSLTTAANTIPLNSFQYDVNRAGLRTVVTETLALASRTIHYGYDGLQRLTSAVETPGTTAAYAYDATGNRTDVWINGTLNEHHDYNAANQVVGWTYDAAGNLTGDGTATYEYDTFNRMVSRSQGSVTTNYTYDADGVLVAQERNGVSTEYTQDLAAPLSQVLQIQQGTSTTNYLYGLERLAAANGSAKTWYAGDALGSVRQTMNDAGALLSTVNYDPWGQVESGNVPTFGFAGELQDTMTGLVNLRARWYSTAKGTFTTRDSFSGYPDRPYSQHPYQYASSDPVLRTDPSGHCDGAGDDYCHEISSWAEFQRRYSEKYYLADDWEVYGPERGFDPRAVGAWAKAFETYQRNPSAYQGLNDPVRLYAESFAQNVLHQLLNHAVPSGQEAFAELPDDATEEDFWKWAAYQLETNPSYELGQSIGCAVNDVKAWRAGGTSGTRGGVFFAGEDVTAYEPEGPIVGQETPYSCLAACIKGVMNRPDVAEAQIRVLAKINREEGGDLVNAPAAFKEFGISARFAKDLTIADLKAATKHGPVIVRIQKPGAFGPGHAVIVDGFVNGKVLIRDPAPQWEGSAYSVAESVFERRGQHEKFFRAVILDP